MDVIGNNIANVNTTAFKSSRVTLRMFTIRQFQMLHPIQTVRAVQTKSDRLRTTVSTIDVINTRGGITTTDRALDLILQATVIM
jgi:flagellar hook protein FlgE